MKRFWRKIQDLPFRSRIILTFTFITILLVSTLAWIGYFTVREIYLSQLGEQVDLLTRLISADLDTRYLDFLEPEGAGQLTEKYYSENLARKVGGMSLLQTFIFNADFRTLVQTDTSGNYLNPEPAMLLNLNELKNLKTGKSMISFPFRGNDGLWYLWGFYRLNENYYLGVQESAGRFAKVDQLSTLFWAIGLGGVLLTTLAGWLLASTLARPIDKLVKFSAALGSGDFATPLPHGIRGELAILGGALDRMRNDLRRNHREKEEMLAQIAHEIRNPLGGIELLAGLVKEDLQNQEQDPAYAEKIMEEISGLKSLISAYLNFSRPVRAVPGQVRISDVVREVEDMLKNRLQQKSISISYPAEEACVAFDPNHLRQILINLVSNSLELSPEHSAITVEAENFGKVKRIRVSDNGPGIPEAELSKIFEPFFSGRKDGTGLGLAICRKLCTENGAKIFAANNTGGGCTFSIEIAKG